MSRRSLSRERGSSDSDDGYYVPRPRRVARRTTRRSVSRERGSSSDSDDGYYIPRPRRVVRRTSRRMDRRSPSPSYYYQPVAPMVAGYNDGLVLYNHPQGGLYGGPQGNQQGFGDNNYHRGCELCNRGYGGDF